MNKKKKKMSGAKVVYDLYTTFAPYPKIFKKVQCPFS
jgi:hypothetical protein